MKFFLRIVAAVAGVACLVLAFPVYVYFINYNFATVEKGAFYRSRQMSGEALERYIKKYGIRTVLNMRGKNEGTPWYDEEVAVCREQGVAHESFSWSMRSLPPPESLARFVTLVESGGKPFLVHCEGGTHRAGVASACYVLLEGGDAAAARKQFGPMFKDAPIGRLIDLYEGNSMPFRQWALEEYPYLYEATKSSQAAWRQFAVGLPYCSVVQGAREDRYAATGGAKPSSSRQRDRKSCTLPGAPPVRNIMAANRVLTFSSGRVST